MKTHTPFAILSAERSGLSPAENAARTGYLRNALESELALFAQALGYYAGNTESSFIVLLPGGDSGALFDTVQALAARFAQESVLYVGADRQACLFYGNGDLQHLGAWREVSSEVAALSNAYTERAGRYYVAGAS